MRFLHQSIFKIPGRSSQNRLLPYNQMLLWAAIIGLLGGVIATGYYLILKGGLFLIWDIINPFLQQLIYKENTVGILPLVILTTSGGLLVGIAVKYLKAPGEISAVVNNIHVKHGKMDFKQNVSMFVNSVISIVFGGSAGPEAPLVQIIGSSGGKLAEKLRLHNDLVRTFTFCGMAAALGAFFGAPIGGALFALEIPHNRGLEYYEALIPSVVSALAAFTVFRWFIGYHGALYNLPVLTETSIFNIFEGVVMGLIGALIAILFIFIFRNTERILRPLDKYPIALGTTGGLAIGLLAGFFHAQFISTPLFWSEFEIVDLLSGIPTLQNEFSLGLALGLLSLLVLAKMLSIGFTLHSGFRGGFIFPLFFIGAVCGILISLATGQWISMPVAIVGLMAAVNVGVTKTPISTSVILTSLTGSALLPVIAASSIVSYVCTEKVRLIDTQQHRRDNPSPMHRVWRWKED